MVYHVCICINKVNCITSFYNILQILKKIVVRYFVSFVSNFFHQGLNNSKYSIYLWPFQDTDAKWPYFLVRWNLGELWKSLRFVHRWVTEKGLEMFPYPLWVKGPFVPELESELESVNPYWQQSGSYFCTLTERVRKLKFVFLFILASIPYWQS